MAVYLDMVMGLNFLVDLLLLLGTNRLSGFPMDGKRAVAGAVFGGVYSGACMVPGFYFLGNGFWRLVSLALMASIAFGWSRSAVRRGVVFVLLSMALGGIAVGFGQRSFPVLVLSAAGVWILCHVGFGGSLGQSYIPISISHQGCNLRFLALKDTGNTLRDPVTGERVIVLSADVAQMLTGLTAADLENPTQTLVSNPGYRLIPYHAVGQPSGMLLAKRFTDVTVGKKQGSALVAFAPEIIDRSGSYQALTGGAV